MNFNLVVNGNEHQIQGDPKMPLLWALRENLGLTGTKYSCGIGLCGACTVHLDGLAIQSCVTQLSEAEGKTVTTIEGLSVEENHPLQIHWLNENVSQCGYCQPGQIMTAAAFLSNNQSPSDDDINSAMSGNLCRCGTYQRIRRAIYRTIEMGGL